MGQRKIRVYICGPISGIPEHNKPAFDAMESELRSLGLEPINPHLTCAHIKREFYPTDKDHWQACMRADIRELMRADMITLLPGWENSKGAKIEIALARELSIKEFKLRPGNGGAEQK
jgi:Domain of unknown function (DUF4406)